MCLISNNSCFPITLVACSVPQVNSLLLLLLLLYSVISIIVVY